jgi:hypothetical protein
MSHEAVLAEYRHFLERRNRGISKAIQEGKPRSATDLEDPEDVAADETELVVMFDWLDEHGWGNPRTILLKMRTNFGVSPSDARFMYDTWLDNLVGNPHSSHRGVF